jgi:hypothetical protein
MRMLLHANSEEKTKVKKISEAHQILAGTRSKSAGANLWKSAPPLGKPN